MKKEIVKQQEYAQSLIKLIAENPTLRIVPMVHYEVVGGDECSYWGGSWGEACIDEFYSDDERIYFKSNDVEDLEQKYIDNYDEGHPTNEKEIERWSIEQVENLPWEKVIAVYITTP